MRGEHGEKAKSDAPRPFFIVGAPRAGTTLLRSLLSAHSHIAIPTESRFLVEYLEADHVPLDKRKRLLLVDPELRYWQTPFAPSALDDCDDMPAAIARVHELYAQHRGKTVWGQKTPKMVRHVDILATSFKDAVFVHMVRDPRAVAASLKVSKAHQLQPLYGAKRYVQDVEHGLAAERKFGNRVVRISYESLVADPEGELKRLLAIIGLGFEIAMLEGAPVELTPQEQRFGHHTNVRRPVGASHGKRFHDILTRDELCSVESACGPLMAELGYESISRGALSLSARSRAWVKHTLGSARKAASELLTRKDVLQVAWRRVRLGSMKNMLGEHFRGL